MYNVFKKKDIQIVTCSHCHHLVILSHSEENMSYTITTYGRFEQCLIDVVSHWPLTSSTNGSSLYMWKSAWSTLNTCSNCISCFFSSVTWFRVTFCLNLMYSIVKLVTFGCLVSQGIITVNITCMIRYETHILLHLYYCYNCAKNYQSHSWIDSSAEIKQYATLLTTYCSPWQHHMESENQFEKGSSHCRNVTRNLGK